MRKIFFILFILFAYIKAEEIYTLKYPLTSNNKERDSYQLDLIKFILNKMNVKYKIESTKQVFTQARIISELKHGNLINIYWMGTSAQLEKEFQAIKFPIYRGLLGHRIFIINKEDQKLFNTIKTLDDLQKFKGAQGIGWSDIAILESSGLEQHAAKYENIFNMINRGGRVSYFSRGLNEAFDEVESRKSNLSNLKVEDNIVLIYPFSMFLFLNKENKKLYTVLKTGFEKAYKDGSFQKFFYSHPKIAESIKKSNLKNRIKIEIPNPFLTPDTLNIENTYWHGK